MGVCAEGDAEGAGKTEIGKLQVAILVDQQVLGLQVSVEHAVRVAELDAVAELAHELLDDGGAQAQVRQLPTSALGQRLASATIGYGQGLHVLLEVEIEEFEDEVQLVAIGVDDVEQADDVGISHLLEQGDLSDGRGRDALVLSLEANFLQGDDSVVVQTV